MNKQKKNNMVKINRNHEHWSEACRISDTLLSQTKIAKRTIKRERCKLRKLMIFFSAFFMCKM